MIFGLDTAPVVAETIVSGCAPFFLGLRHVGEGVFFGNQVVLGRGSPPA
jgi:hypothetical protein